MADHPPGRPAARGLVWFLVSVHGSVGGAWLARRTLVRYTDPPPGGFAWLVLGLALIVLAGVPAGKLAGRRLLVAAPARRGEPLPAGPRALRRPAHLAPRVGRDGPRLDARDLYVNSKKPQDTKGE